VADQKLRKRLWDGLSKSIFDALQTNLSGDVKKLTTTTVRLGLKFDDEPGKLLT
jgi:hypothetical protein